MPMLEIHADALNSSTTIQHEFLLRYKHRSNTVYGIVEGKEDPAFYRGIIEHHLPLGWEVDLISAGCKKNVLRAAATIDRKKITSGRLCFFIDRDLSNFFPEEKISETIIYVTDNYSIENDLVNFGTIKRVLSEVFNINDLTPPESEKIQGLFDSSLLLFKSSIAPIMVQIIKWRRSGRNPKLNNIKINDFFSFSDGALTLKKEFDTRDSIIRKAGLDTELSPSEESELLSTYSEFDSHKGIEKFIRGKYLIWFAVEMVLQIHRNIPKIISRYENPPKLNSSFGHKNAMISLAPRARCPNSLHEFLRSNYAKYIADTTLQQHTC